MLKILEKIEIALLGAGVPTILLSIIDGSYHYGTAGQFLHPLTYVAFVITAITAAALIDAYIAKNS